MVHLCRVMRPSRCTDFSISFSSFSSGIFTGHDALRFLTLVAVVVVRGFVVV